MNVITAITYSKPNNKEPLTDWLNSLDVVPRGRIFKRLEQLKKGNFGDCWPVSEGVFELRMDFGPGYRVYFGEVSKTIVVLLMGGDKGVQQRDIDKAKEYWRDYQGLLDGKNKRSQAKKI